jgi:uncharacterized protein (TIGR03067 family)
MKARLLLVLALLLCYVVQAAPLPKPKPSKKTTSILQAMQGLWEVQSRVRGHGPPLTVPVTQKFVKIEGNTWTFLRADATTPGGTTCQIQLDPNHKPALLDLIFNAPVGGAARPAGLNLLYTGRVEVDGNTMRFCYTLRKERPATMTPQNVGEYLLTLQRVQK